MATVRKRQRASSFTSDKSDWSKVRQWTEVPLIVFDDEWKVEPDTATQSEVDEALLDFRGDNSEEQEDENQERSVEEEDDW